MDNLPPPTPPEGDTPPKAENGRGQPSEDPADSGQRGDHSGSHHHHHHHHHKKGQEKDGHHHHHHHHQPEEGEGGGNSLKPENVERKASSINIEIGDPELEEGWSTRVGSHSATDMAAAEEEAGDYFPEDPHNKGGNKLFNMAHRLEDKALNQLHAMKDMGPGSLFHFRQHHQKDSLHRREIDHTPHEMFVELGELQPTSWGGLWWKETARWIKYEEDVEGEDNRWGKPHIPCLNFNALFSLRKGIEQGTVLFDLDERDFPNISNHVVDCMVDCDQISPEYRDSVTKILLLRHQHIKETLNEKRLASRVSPADSTSMTEERLLTSQSAANFERRLPGRRSLANILRTNTLTNFQRRNSSTDGAIFPNGRKQSIFGQVDIDGDSESTAKRMINVDLLKKLPPGAEGTAVLVGNVDFLTEPVMAFIRLAEGEVMENVIEVPIPIRFLFVLLGPNSKEMDYHEVGRCMATLMTHRRFREVAYKAHSRVQLTKAMNEFFNASIVLPPAEWKDSDLIPIDKIRSKTQEIRKRHLMDTTPLIPKIKEPSEVAAAAPSVPEKEDEEKMPRRRDPLVRTGKLFYGMIQDIKIRYSQYPSDFLDGLNMQVLSTCIFIFFAALSPAITFGGMYADLTDRYIGVGETLLVTAVNGLVFGLFAGQPLIIVGSTGPLMIFDISLLQFCQIMDLDFLSIRVWVGVWLLIIGVLVAAFEVVALGKKITRFTEEIFSTLVCLIFIYGAIEKLEHIFLEHPLVKSYDTSNSTLSCDETGNDSSVLSEYGGGSVVEPESGNVTLNVTLEEVHSAGHHAPGILVFQPNTALLSMCLMLGTFIIAWKLKNFRNSKYLGRSVRRTLGDFGVPIAIFLMVLLDFLITDTYTDKLTMPKGLQPSNSAVRGWFINPLGVVSPLPVWCMAAAGLAAMLLFVLIFLEVNICQLILSEPTRCMKKGTGFHLDIVLSCLINLISGLLGAPFMGPACVRTISHMSALTVMNTNVAPGESAKIVGCIEQRVSPITVAILVGLSAMLYMVLNLVPIPVLLGVFLYMGISATAGNQLIERIVLFFKPVKHHPNKPYVKKVRTMKMHLFTVIEILMLVILWIVKKSPVALAMPFVLSCLIPIRLYLLPFIFTKKELIMLDGHEESLPDVESEPDFYHAAHDVPTQIESKGEHES